MLKFRYLYENYSLAKAALRLWPHDAGTLDARLAQFRISANAVYPFEREGALYFLRLAPVTEKLEQNLRREIAFVDYLRTAGYPALAMIPSVRRNRLETVRHEEVLYYAMVSKGVPGVRMDRMDYDEGAMQAYGLGLAALHNLSVAWRPAETKWTYTDVLRWTGEVLAETQAPDVARREVALVAGALDALPKTADTYGLVHYDYELDNVFYDADTGLCHAIDFDDGMMHFFALDVDQALDSIREALPRAVHDGAEAAFLRGYRLARALDDAQLQTEAFRRFAQLYGYARVRRAMAETFPQEPDWMQGLRQRLTALMAERSAQFGTPIQ